MKTPEPIFKKIREIFFWPSRSYMAAALGVTDSELGRAERGEILISGELGERLKMLGVSPETFKKDKDGLFVHHHPLDLKHRPLQKRQPLPAGAITRDLLRCQLHATLDHALEGAPDEGSKLMILLRVQQSVMSLPKRFYHGDDLPLNYLELHRAAVIWGHLQIMQYMLQGGKAVFVGDDRRRLQRRKGGWPEVVLAGKNKMARLQLEFCSTLALSGPQATEDMVHAMVCAGIRFFLAEKLLEPDTEEMMEEYHDLRNFLIGVQVWLGSPRVDLDARIHPGWVIFHLLETISIISSCPKAVDFEAESYPVVP